MRTDIHLNHFATPSQTGNVAEAVVTIDDRELGQIQLRALVQRQGLDTYTVVGQGETIVSMELQSQILAKYNQETATRVRQLLYISADTHGVTVGQALEDLKRRMAAVHPGLTEVLRSRGLYRFATTEYEVFNQASQKWEPVGSGR